MGNPFNAVILKLMDTCVLLALIVCLQRLVQIILLLVLKKEKPAAHKRILRGFKQFNVKTTIIHLRIPMLFSHLQEMRKFFLLLVQQQVVLMQTNLASSRSSLPKSLITNAQQRVMSLVITKLGALQRWMIQEIILGVKETMDFVNQDVNLTLLMKRKYVKLQRLNLGNRNHVVFLSTGKV